jgi:pimeloyl-ACP methyl ester carboxylesterase
MPYVQAGEVRLYYEERGEGAPLVLVPGFGAGMWIWYKQIPALAERFRVVSFDPRGVARSGDGGVGELSTRLLADDVAALLDALGLRDAHILGGSFGGFVAQEFALAYPARTRGLILCCTSFGGPGHRPPRPATLEAIASTKGLNTQDRVRRNLLLAFSPRFAEESPGEVERVVRLRDENHVPERVYLQQLQAAVSFDARPRVAHIRAPTLVITGDEDAVVPHENSVNLAALIPGARLRVVAGGSHAFFIERAEEFNRAVADFVESVEGHKVS